MALIDAIAPQMTAYSKQFHTDGDVDWQPYLMFFHPKNYRSAVVNTDAAGFRFSERDGRKYSIANGSECTSARLLAGNSVAFGIGASSDRATAASRMMVHDAKQEPWLNFGGRAFNSAQELVLLTLYRHMLPKIEEIVLLSGANNLLLARLPETYIQEHGAFYNCGRFFETFHEDIVDSSESKFSIFKLFRKTEKPVFRENSRSIEERIRFAADLTLRHLDGWHALAKDMGARLTFVLQPMARWVRARGSTEEEALFAELESLSRFTTVRSDILRNSVGESYASLLEAGVRSRGIAFIDMNPAIRAAARDDQWLFVDHTHLTDDGYDLLARLIIRST